MKKLLLLSLTLAVMLCGCESIDNNAQIDNPTVTTVATASDGTTAESNNSVAISVITQQYDDATTAEILQFTGAEVSLNERIKAELINVYNTHIQNLASDPEYAGTLEIKSYPFSNENYLQIVSTLCEFPVYGTDGQIYSYNYDIKNNTAITLDEIVAKYNITDQDLLQSISTKFKPESETRQITLIEPAAFRIISDDEAEIYVYVHSDDPNSTPDSRIWKYNTKSKGCSQYNGTTLFSADVPDQMEPPLLYQQNQ